MSRDSKDIKRKWFKITVILFISLIIIILTLQGYSRIIAGELIEAIENNDEHMIEILMSKYFNPNVTYKHLVCTS